MPHKIGQLHIHDPHRSARVGEILVQKPSEPDGPNLLVIIELDSNQAGDLEFIQNFLEAAFDVFQQSQINLPEKILENILQGLNQYLPEIAPKKYDWLKNLHCFIGVLTEHQIHFTVLGKIKTYLIKPNLIKEASGKPPLPEKGSIFDYTISGELQNEDRFLITNDSLTNYIAADKIKKIVSALPPQSAIAHLGNILEAVPPTVSFFSVIIEFIKNSEAAENELGTNRRLAVPTGSKNSMEQLLKTQQETEKILTPPSIVELIKEGIKKRPTDKKEEEGTEDIPADKKTVRTGLKGGLNFKHFQKTGGIFRKLGSGIKKLWLLITDKKDRESLWPKVNNFFSDLIKKYNRLPKKTRITVVSVIVLILLFSQSLIWQQKHLDQLKQSENYNTTLLQIQQKQDAIEASLIYSDTARAQQLTVEVNELLKSLPRQTKEQLKKYEEISEQSSELFNRVWKITSIAEPLSLINFRELNLTAEISSLGFKDNYIYGFNDTDQVFAVNVTNNETLVLDHFNLEAKKIAYFNQADLLIFATADKKFYSVEKNELREITVSLPEEFSQIDELAFYLDKMYILDKGQKQIWRFSWDGRGFVRPTAWLKEDLPLEQATSLAVDGAIYLSSQDGQLTKLSSGEKQDFTQLYLQPPLSEPAKIYTTESSDSVFILDSKDKRFIELSKDGSLKQQYYSEQFNNLKDFIVDEAENKVYLLNGSQVFVVAI